LYVSDRLVLMTDGPEACVGEVMSVPFGRPRTRASVLQHPAYQSCRRRVFEFLEHHARQGGAKRG
jgi:ABC-type nitrate/sulfonate/bicarbonate transport system ATPase subunit